MATGIQFTLAAFHCAGLIAAAAEASAWAGARFAAVRQRSLVLALGPRLLALALQLALGLDYSVQNSESPGRPTTMTSLTIVCTHVVGFKRSVKIFCLDDMAILLRLICRGQFQSAIVNRAGCASMLDVGTWVVRAARAGRGSALGGRTDI